MRRINGVVMGIVTDVEDPESLGRVKLRFPWLSETEESAWAPIASVLAGGDRGNYYLPEVDDEALVAFDQGDFDHPYVLGFLWNGSQTPPNSDINSSVRRLRTVSGHLLEFDDNAGQERIHLRTQGGHDLEMKDSAPAEVRLVTSGGQELVLEDVPGSITATTAGGNKIEIKDVPGSITATTAMGITIEATPAGITISAPTGLVTANCLQASVNAAAMLSVNAPVAQFSGVVIANAIVSSAYTPAPGNTFGL